MFGLVYESTFWEELFIYPLYYDVLETLEFFLSFLLWVISSYEVFTLIYYYCWDCYYNCEVYVIKIESSGYYSLLLLYASFSISSVYYSYISIWGFYASYIYNIGSQKPCP